MTSPPSPLEGPPDREPDVPAGDRLPPGQHEPRGWPVLHYGKVPEFRPDRWDLTVVGATADGRQHRFDWAQVAALPRTELTADLHCVTRFTVPDRTWSGVAFTTLLALAPPHPHATHVMAWAENGYSANLRIEDLVAGALLATHHAGSPLPPDRGAPLRLVVPHRYAYKGPKWLRSLEYLIEDRRGFWESRGYHNRADPWREQRWSYQEEPGDGPPCASVDPRRR